MLYLLYGENETEINKYIESIIKEQKIETKITYNYKETDIKDVIEEASYLDLFGNKKAIILNESDFLTSKSTLENKAFDLYLENPNKDTILIFKIITEKLDERKKLVKTLKDKCIVKEFKLLDEKSLPNYIRNFFEINKYKIKEEAVKEITSRLTSNPKVLDAELDKLLMYKYEEREITLEDVKKVTTKYEENKIFKLVDAVIKKDKSKVFKLYKELIENKEEPTVILVLLANQFRLLYQTKVLSEKGLDKYKIATKLKEHHYRVALALESGKGVEKEELLKILRTLGEIDYQIKTGALDKVKALELFFLEL